MSEVELKQPDCPMCGCAIVKLKEHNYVMHTIATHFCKLNRAVFTPEEWRKLSSRPSDVKMSEATARELVRVYVSDLLIDDDRLTPIKAIELEDVVKLLMEHGKEKV